MVREDKPVIRFGRGNVNGSSNSQNHIYRYGVVHTPGLAIPHSFVENVLLHHLSTNRGTVNGSVEPSHL